MFKKWLSLLLCVCMLLSCLPVSMIAEEGVEEPAWEEVVVESAPEEPEPAPQPEAPKEEAPAKEESAPKESVEETPAVEEEPTEEAPAEEPTEEEPTEEAPAEEPTEEEPTEEAPAEEPTEEEPTEEEPTEEEPTEEEPTEEEPTEEEPTEEEPAEEEPTEEEPAEDRYAYCYARVSRGATVYADGYRSETLGQFEDDAIVYVAAREEAEDVGHDMLTIWFAANGEAQTAYVLARDAQKIEESEIVFPAEPVVCEEIRLLDAAIAAAEEEPTEEEPTEEEPAADRFAACYALVHAGAAVYADGERAAALGQFENDAIVYVAAREEAEDAEQDMLTIWFAANGEAQTAYVLARDAQKIEESEIAFPEEPVVCEEIRLLDAAIVAAEEEQIEERADGEPQPQVDNAWEEAPVLEIRQTGSLAVTIVVKGSEKASGFNLYEDKNGKISQIKSVLNPETAKGTVEIQLKSVAVGTHTYFAKPYLQEGRVKTEGLNASEHVPFEVQKTPVAPKIKISQKKECEGRVELIWTDKTTNTDADSYRIYEDDTLVCSFKRDSMPFEDGRVMVTEKIDEKTKVVTYTAIIDDVSATASGLTHKYKIQGVTSNGTPGAAGAASVKVIQYWATIPTLSVVAAKGKGEVTITVTPPASIKDTPADGYEIFYAPSKNDPISIATLKNGTEELSVVIEENWLNIEGAPQCIFSAQNLEATLTSLKDGSYTFYAVPVKGEGEAKESGKMSVKKSVTVKNTWQNAVTGLTAVQDKDKGDGVVKLTFKHALTEQKVIIKSKIGDEIKELEPLDDPAPTENKGTYTKWVKVDPTESVAFEVTTIDVNRLGGTEISEKSATSKPIAVVDLWTFAPTLNVTYNSGSSQITMDVLPAYPSEDPADKYEIYILKNKERELVATLKANGPEQYSKCESVCDDCVLRTEGLSLTLSSVKNNSYTFVVVPVKTVNGLEVNGKESAKKAVKVNATWGNPASGLNAVQGSEMFTKDGVDYCNVKLTFKHGVKKDQMFIVSYSDGSNTTKVWPESFVGNGNGTYTVEIPVPADCITDYSFTVTPYIVVKDSNGGTSEDVGKESTAKKLQIRPLWALVPTLTATPTRNEGIITLTVQPNNPDYLADGYEIKYVPSKGAPVSLGTIQLNKNNSYSIDASMGFPCKVETNGFSEGEKQTVTMTLYHLSNGTFGFTATPVMIDGREGITSLKKSATASTPWKKTVTNVAAVQKPELGEGVAQVKFKNPVANNSSVYFKLYNEKYEKQTLYDLVNGKLQEIDAAKVNAVSGVYTVYVKLDPKVSGKTCVYISLAMNDENDEWGENEAALVKSPEFVLQPLWMLRPTVMKPVQPDDGKVRIDFEAGYAEPDAYEIVKTVARAEADRVYIEASSGVYSWLDENAVAGKAATYQVTPLKYDENDEIIRGNSTSVSFTPKANLWKLAPQNLVGRDIGRGMILTWQPQGTAQSYNIYEIVGNKTLAVTNVKEPIFRIESGNMTPGVHKYIVEPQQDEPKVIKGAKSKPVEVIVTEGLVIGFEANCTETRPDRDKEIVWTVSIDKCVTPYKVIVSVKDQDDNVVKTEEFSIEEHSFTYAYKPTAAGSYRLEVEAKDSSNPPFARTAASSAVKVYVPDFEVNEDGVLTQYRGSDVDIVIPKAVMGDEIKKIGPNAFQNENKTEIRTVTVQAPITEIGEGAFEGCTGLTKVSLPDDVVVIRARAFKGCTSLSTMD